MVRFGWYRFVCRKVLTLPFSCQSGKKAKASKHATFSVTRLITFALKHVDQKWLPQSKDKFTPHGIFNDGAVESKKVKAKALRVSFIFHGSTLISHDLLRPNKESLFAEAVGLHYVCSHRLMSISTCKEFSFLRRNAYQIIPPPR